MTPFEYIVGITGLISFAASHLLVAIVETRRRTRKSRSVQRRHL
mgnify:CR=1 FL=1